jgi:predicted  nucleic acid-binding Zn-ribbon protein
MDKIRILRGELPLEVEDLENEIVGLKTRIQNTEEEVSAIRQRINELKTKIDLPRRSATNISRTSTTCATNREYDMLNKKSNSRTWRSSSPRSVSARHSMPKPRRRS